MVRGAAEGWIARLYRGNNDGTFKAPLELDAGAGIVSVATTDLDGDGTADVVVGY